MVNPLLSDFGPDDTADDLCQGMVVIVGPPLAVDESEPLERLKVEADVDLKAVSIRTEARGCAAEQRLGGPGIEPPSDEIDLAPPEGHVVLAGEAVQQRLHPLGGRALPEVDARVEQGIPVRPFQRKAVIVVDAEQLLLVALDGLGQTEDVVRRGVAVSEEPVQALPDEAAIVEDRYRLHKKYPLPTLDTRRRKGTWLSGAS